MSMTILLSTLMGALVLGNPFDLMGASSELDHKNNNSNEVKERGEGSSRKCIMIGRRVELEFPFFSDSAAIIKSNEQPSTQILRTFDNGTVYLSPMASNSTFPPFLVE